jgi:E3 ubiquitin-protein ligase HERC2
LVFYSTCDRPRVIESLRGKEVVDIAAGGAHSACITANGELYTWGKGRYGRLGHGDSEDQSKPKLVEALKGYRVIDVACGSGDAQTLCITDDDNVKYFITQGYLQDSLDNNERKGRKTTYGIGIYPAII